MLIMLSIVFRLYLCQSLIQHQIHTTIKDHKFIFLQLIYQNILVLTKMMFLIKLFICMTVQHHIPWIWLFF